MGTGGRAVMFVDKGGGSHGGKKMILLLGWNCSDLPQATTIRLFFFSFFLLFLLDRWYIY